MGLFRRLLLSFRDWPHFCATRPLAPAVFIGPLTEAEFARGSSGRTVVACARPYLDTWGVGVVISFFCQVLAANNDIYLTGITRQMMHCKPILSFLAHSIHNSASFANSYAIRFLNMTDLFLNFQLIYAALLVRSYSLVFQLCCVNLLICHVCIPLVVGTVPSCWLAWRFRPFSGSPPRAIIRLRKREGKREGGRVK